MAQQLMLGEQGDVLVLGDFRCIPGLLGQLVIPQLLCRLDDRFAGGLRDGAPVVEDLGDRVPAETAGVGNVLNGDSFERHERLSFLWAVCSIYYSMRAMKKQDVQNVNRRKTVRTTHSVS